VIWCRRLAVVVVVAIVQVVVIRPIVAVMCRPDQM
jgi:hypothetical protein